MVGAAIVNLRGIRKGVANRESILVFDKSWLSILTFYMRADIVDGHEQYLSSRRARDHCQFDGNSSRFISRCSRRVVRIRSRHRFHRKIYGPGRAHFGGKRASSISSAWPLTQRRELFAASGHGQHDLQNRRERNENDFHFGSAAGRSRSRLIPMTTFSRAISEPERS